MGSFKNQPTLLKQLKKQWIKHGSLLNLQHELMLYPLFFQCFKYFSELTRCLHFSWFLNDPYLHVYNQKSYQVFLYINARLVYSINARSMHWVLSICLRRNFPSPSLLYCTNCELRSVSYHISFAVVLCTWYRLRVLIWFVFTLTVLWGIPVS